MPESSVAGSWIGIETLPEFICRNLVPLLAGLFVEHHQQVRSQHIIQRLNRLIEVSRCVKVTIYKSYDVVEQLAVLRPAINDELSNEKQALGIAPATKLLCIWKSLEIGVDDSLRPVFLA